MRPLSFAVMSEYVLVTLDGMSEYALVTLDRMSEYALVTLELDGMEVQRGISASCTMASLMSSMASSYVQEI